MRCLLLLGLIVSFVSVHAADVPAVYPASINTYRGEVINAESILRHTRFSRDEERAFWNPFTAEQIGVIRDIPTMPVTGELDGFVAMKERITASGLVEIPNPHGSGSNFLFEVWINGRKKAVKMAGPGNHRENVNASLNAVRAPEHRKRYGSPITEEEVETFRALNGRFRQTVSRAAAYLLFQEWREQWEKKTGAPCSVTCPKTSLARIPGGRESLDDENYVVVEEWQDLTPVRANSSRFHELVPQIEDAIQCVAIWHVAEHDMGFNGKDELVLLDGEQPNNTNSLGSGPRGDLGTFFHKSRAKFDWNRDEGMRKFEALLQKLPIETPEHAAE